jgi:hypothetical protein
MISESGPFRFVDKILWDGGKSINPQDWGSIQIILVIGRQLQISYEFIL